MSTNNVLATCEAHLLNRHTIVFCDMPAVIEWAANEAVEVMQKFFHTQEYNTQKKG